MSEQTYREIILFIYAYTVISNDFFVGYGLKNDGALTVTSLTRKSLPKLLGVTVSIVDQHSNNISIYRYLLQLRIFHRNLGYYFHSELLTDVRHRSL